MYKLLAIMFSLLVGWGISTTTKTLVSVRMTSPVFFQHGIGVLYNKYWAINQKRIDIPHDYTHMAIRQKNGTSYWPFNATQIAFSGEYDLTNTTLTHVNFPVRGFYNTPYYGPGLYLNWTFLYRSDTNTAVYLFHYKRIDLGLAPLSQICLKNCYCPHWERPCVSDN